MGNYVRLYRPFISTLIFLLVSQPLVRGWTSHAMDRTWTEIDPIRYIDTRYDSIQRLIASEIPHANSQIVPVSPLPPISSPLSSFLSSMASIRSSHRRIASHVDGGGSTNTSPPFRAISRYSSLSLFLCSTQPPSLILSSSRNVTASSYCLPDAGNRWPRGGRRWLRLDLDLGLERRSRTWSVRRIEDPFSEIRSVYTPPILIRCAVEFFTLVTPTRGYHTRVSSWEWAHLPHNFQLPAGFRKGPTAHLIQVIVNSISRLVQLWPVVLIIVAGPTNPHWRTIVWRWHWY